MKFYVIETTSKGIRYKKYKCIDGWSKDKSECWRFSKQRAKNIADRLNEKHGIHLKRHYNILKAE